MAHDKCKSLVKGAGEPLKILEINVRSEIVNQFKRVAREQDKRLPPLTDGLELLNSGLDSLCFAILVTRLECSLGVDPFTSSQDAHFPVTFGDFINLEEKGEKLDCFAREC